MEYLVAEYTGPLTLSMCGVDVPATAELQHWRGEPHAVDEIGQVVYHLDPEAPPRWVGTVTVVAGVR